MVNLAIDQRLIGDFQQAEKNFRSCLDISRRLGQLESNEISCLRELGDLYTQLGRFPEAAAFLDRALQLAHSQTSRYEPAILINQAHLHLAQGDPFRALDLAKEAESASKRFNEPGRLDERYAIALCLAMGAQNKLEEAKGLLKEALHDAGNASLTAMRAQLLLALAQCSGPGAEDLARQALQLAVQGDYVPLEADAYTGLGRLALLSNDLDAAQRHGERALTRSRQRKDPRTRAYRDIPADNPYRYELGHRRATELLRQVSFARR
jgi:tetratricopeptide (TPR) repeat protein